MPSLDQLGVIVVTNSLFDRVSPMPRPDCDAGHSASPVKQPPHDTLANVHVSTGRAHDVGVVAHLRKAQTKTRARKFGGTMLPLAARREQEGIW